MRLTLSNVINQLLGNIPFEIVIADGGSNDGTIPFIKRFQQQNKNIKLIEHGKLIGSSSAHHDCLKNSNGEYVVFLSDHTLILGQSFIESLELLNNNNEIFGVAQKLCIPRKQYPYAATYHRKLMSIVPFETVIFRRKCIINAFDDNYKKHYWPLDLTMKCLADKGIIVHAKNYGAFHIDITENDDMHYDTIKNKYSKKDRLYFQDKWNWLTKFVKSEMSVISKVKYYLVNKIFWIFFRFINGRKFDIISSLLYKLGFGYKIPDLIPNNYQFELPNSIRDGLDLEIRFSAIERIVDWLNERFSAIRTNNMHNNKNFFFFQQITFDYKKK